MFYAIYRSNVDDRVIGFIVESEEEEFPIYDESEKRLTERLKDHPLMEAGLIEIIEL